MANRFHALSVAAACHAAVIVDGMAVFLRGLSPAATKRGSRTIVAIAMAMALTSCGRQEESTTNTEPLLHTKQFASMAPSNTELVYSIGADKQMVAVCNQCDYPTAVKQKPQIGSFTSVDLERALQLKPDTVFLVDGQEQLEDTIAKQPSLHCQTVVLHNRRVKDIAQNLSILGSYTGRDAEASALFKRFINDITDFTALIAATEARGPRVFFCVWPQPLTTVGRDSYLNDAITICGGDNVAVNLTQAYPQFNAEQLVKAEPDVIILPHEAVGQDFMNKPPWTSLPAVANKQVYYLPPRDQDRLSRPTMRILPGLVWLAERLHPELQPKIRQFASQRLHLSPDSQN